MIPPNLSFNFSMPADNPCLSGGVMEAECIIREFCPQVSHYLTNTAVGLLIAYLVVDFLLPLILPRVVAGMVSRGQRPTIPLFGDLSLKENRLRLFAFAREHLLYVMAVFCGMVFYFSNI